MLNSVVQRSDRNFPRRYFDIPLQQRDRLPFQSGYPHNCGEEGAIYIVLRVENRLDFNFGCEKLKDSERKIAKEKFEFSVKISFT